MADPIILPEDIAAYERDGAVLIRSGLNSQLCELLQRGVEETHLNKARQATSVKGVGKSGVTTVYDYALRSSPSLTMLMQSGVLGGIAASLMRTSAAHLILDQIFYKPKGVILPTPWHQDTPFLRVRGMDLIRLWSPCDFSPKALTVQVVRGSHRWNTVYRAGRDTTEAGKDDRPPVGDYWLPSAPDVRNHKSSFDIMSWDVAPGDVLAFQGNMLHGTDGSDGTESPRRAFAVLMGGPQLRYHVPDGKAFPSPGRFMGLRSKDDIPSGAPIGDYPDAFPLC